MDTQLITLSDIQEFKGITSNLNQAKDLLPHIWEAQDFDLRLFLGEAFYLSLLDEFEASPSLGDTAYYDLFHGKRYTYSGEEYEFKGVKAILVYHTYARYLKEAGSTSTPTGRVQKVTPYSNPVDPRVNGMLIKQARSGAMVHQDRLKCYLDRFPSLYPLWKCSGGKKYKGGINIRRIG